MRLLPGRSGWWCVAPSGVALLPDGHVDGGRLTAAGLAALRATGVTQPPTATSYALTVLTATGCNLGCSYCFQNTGPAAPGRSDPPRIRAAALDAGTTGSIVDFARRRMRAASLSRLHVVLFGGEPLTNPAGCDELLRRARDAGDVSAEMISNGTLLHPGRAARLHALGLGSVQITLDGPRRVHDLVRVTRRGRGTFDRILRNVAAAQRETGLRHTIRLNLTPAVRPLLKSLIEEVAARVDAARCLLRIAPLVGAVDPAGAPAAAEVVAAYGHGQALGFRIPLPSGRPCAFCARPAGRTGAVVNADGTLFSCWESAGRPGFEVGTVERGYAAYEPRRWVRCRGAAPAPGGYADAVDAGLLDLAWTKRS